MPFMMPLLCVAARYGIGVRRTRRRRASAPRPPRPPSPSRPRAATGTRTAARASRRSARFERMRRHAVPPVISSTIGASPSTSELMALAPMASPVSTMTCTTTMVSPRGVAHQAHLDVARPGAALAQAGRQLRPPPPAARARGRVSRSTARRRIGHAHELDLADHGARRRPRRRTRRRHAPPAPRSRRPR